MIHLNKQKFPKEKYTKLMKKRIGPFRIIHKSRNNSYKIDLPPDIGLSPIFNVANIFPYKGDMEEVMEVADQSDE